MRVSARCDYACKALLELALNWPGKEPLHIHVISKRQDIPMKYLVQILIQLKRQGLVSSIRGKAGGYILAKPPRDITLGRVMRQIGGPLLPVSGSASKNGSVFAAVWDEVEDAMAKILDKITFADISKKVKKQDKALSYHI